jgi:transglutaminase-like putative cysteine protease
MMTTRRLLYFACFVGLAITAALVIDRLGRPSVAGSLVATVVVASLAGAPGLAHRRAWPLAIVLLPLGAYLLLRVQVPIPADTHGLGTQASFLVEQLRAGAQAYGRHTFPLDLATATHVGLVLSLVVYAAVGLAAFLALSLRLPIPGLAIILVVLGFAFTTDSTAKVVWAPLAFLLLGGCLLAFSRSLQRDRWRATDALSGAAAAVIAVVLALSLLGTTSVAASQPWRDWSAWGIPGPQSTRLSFDWMDNFPGLLDPATNAPVMRVTSPVASYWRANALTSFDGTAWSSANLFADQLVPTWSSGNYRYVMPGTDPAVRGRLVTESFQVVSTYTDHLFTGGSAKSLLVASQLTLRVPDTGAIGLTSSMGPSLDYSIAAVVPHLRPADLLGRGRDYPEAVLSQDTALPFPAMSDLAGLSPESAWRLAISDTAAHREWLDLYDLNRRIVGTTNDPYSIALKVEEYLRSHYAYSLMPPQNGYRSPYAAFLFRTRTGYCQHFAGAMAVLLRFNGVPARVAVGFTSGERGKDGRFLVTRNDAHAWVEAYFPEVGWVSFDPTPGGAIPGSGRSSETADFVAPVGRIGTGDAAGTAGAKTSAGALGKNRGARARDASGAAASVSARSAVRLLAGAALVVMLVAWPMARAARRKRGSSRGGWDARLRATLALMYADLQDHGIGVSRSQTLDETARYLNDYFDMDASAVVQRVQAVLFGGRAATKGDVADIAAFRRELKRRIRARSGRLRRVLALYGVSGVLTVKSEETERPACHELAQRSGGLVAIARPIVGQSSSRMG